MHHKVLHLFNNCWLVSHAQKNYNYYRKHNFSDHSPLITIIIDIVMLFFLTPVVMSWPSNNFLNFLSLFLKGNLVYTFCVKMFCTECSFNSSVFFFLCLFLSTYKLLLRAFSCYLGTSLCFFIHISGSVIESQHCHSGSFTEHAAVCRTDVSQS